MSSNSSTSPLATVGNLANHFDAAAISTPIAGSGSGLLAVNNAVLVQATKVTIGILCNFTYKGVNKLQTDTKLATRSGVHFNRNDYIADDVFHIAQMSLTSGGHIIKGTFDWKDK